MSTETETWPFDADQNDPLAALRIPVVTNPYTGWKYEVALVITEPGSANDIWGSAMRPDEAEVRQIVAYLEYRMEYYNGGWKAKMRRRPLDVDSSTNTVILQKRGEGDWCYRRASWRTGPTMVPSDYDNEPHLTLPQLLDRINSNIPGMNARWDSWKAVHPEAFPVPGSTEGAE